MYSITVPLIFILITSAVCTFVCLKVLSKSYREIFPILVLMSITLVGLSFLIGLRTVDYYKIKTQKIELIGKTKVNQMVLRTNVERRSFDFCIKKDYGNICTESIIGLYEKAISVRSEAPVEFYQIINDPNWVYLEKERYIIAIVGKNGL
jgi:hypothetical protein